jgi:hypothetical protein
MRTIPDIENAAKVMFNMGFDKIIGEHRGCIFGILRNRRESPVEYSVFLYQPSDEHDIDDPELFNFHVADHGFDTLSQCLHSVYRFCIEMGERAT